MNECYIMLNKMCVKLSTLCAENLVWADNVSRTHCSCDTDNDTVVTLNQYIATFFKMLRHGVTVKVLP